MDERYKEIINIEPPEPRNHARMSSLARAAQFAPFAALSGFEGAVLEAARVTEKQIELDEYEIAELNGRLREIGSSADERTVKLTFFVKDKRKPGGSYVTLIDTVSKIDEIEQKLVTGMGQTVKFENIIKIEEP